MNIKPVAKRFYDDLMLDSMPSSLAVLVDFGFNHAHPQKRLYEAYQKGARAGTFTLEEMSEAVGDGPALTRLIQRVDSSLEVVTDYDFLDEPM